VGRRRRPSPVTGLVTGAVLLAVAACGSGSDGSRASSGSTTGSGTRTSAAPSTSVPPTLLTCAEQTLGTLDLDRQVGQLLMVGVPATDPVGGFAELSDVPVGGVFLRGRSSAGAQAIGAAIAQVQAAASLPLQVAVDQEGGAVQTLKGSGFDVLPSASAQAEQGPEALRVAVAGWAAQLRSAGITMDLGPVADTVPAGTEADNPPIGAFDRQYGSDPAQVADAVTATVGGLQDAGVVATAKHFPGLGRVQVNTDTDVGATDPETSPADPFLAPFAAAVTAGTGAVMISSATYPQLDPDRLAVFSPAVLRLLRDQLGFDGVVITDDLGMAVALTGVPVGQRAVDAVAAGVDVVLTVSPADAAPMAQALADRAAADPTFAPRVRESAGRVLALKERFGLLTC
jgi:beta-N-acetylhexosaminidase